MSLALPITIALPCPASDYRRQPLGWIKRRARRLQHAYGITRRIAVFDARRDYYDFVGLHHHNVLKLVKGGANG